MRFSKHFLIKLIFILFLTIIGTTFAFAQSKNGKIIMVKGVIISPEKPLVMIVSKIRGSALYGYNSRSHVLKVTQHGNSSHNMTVANKHPANVDSGLRINFERATVGKKVISNSSFEVFFMVGPSSSLTLTMADSETITLMPNTILGIDKAYFYLKGKPTDLKIYLSLKLDLLTGEIQTQKIPSPKGKSSFIKVIRYIQSHSIFDYDLNSIYAQIKIHKGLFTFNPFAIKVNKGVAFFNQPNGKENTMVYPGQIAFVGAIGVSAPKDIATRNIFSITEPQLNSYVANLTSNIDAFFGKDNVAQELIAANGIISSAANTGSGKVIVK